MSVLSAAHHSSENSTAVAHEPFRELLLTQRSACSDELGRVAVALLDDRADTVTLARRASLERTLEQVDKALGRIAAGTYGACVDCGTAIPVERLELRPHAAACVSCSTAS